MVDFGAGFHHVSQVLIVIKRPLRTESSSSFLYHYVVLRVSWSNFFPFIIFCIFFPCACPSPPYEQLFDILSELLTARFPPLLLFLCWGSNLLRFRWPNLPNFPIPTILFTFPFYFLRSATPLSLATVTNTLLKLYNANSSDFFFSKATFPVCTIFQSPFPTKTLNLAESECVSFSNSIIS